MLLLRRRVEGRSSSTSKPSRSQRQQRGATRRGRRRSGHPPKDYDAWEKIATHRSDARGEARGEIDAPPNVIRGLGSALELVARGRVDGHNLVAKASATVGLPQSTAELLPEPGHLVPGVSQRLLLRVRDGHDAPVKAAFRVESDGLASDATTDAHGEVELTWKTPIDIGASFISHFGKPWRGPSPSTRGSRSRLASRLPHPSTA